MVSKERMRLESFDFANWTYYDYYKWTGAYGIGEGEKRRPKLMHLIRHFNYVNNILINREIDPFSYKITRKITGSFCSSMDILIFHKLHPARQFHETSSAYSYIEKTKKALIKSRFKPSYFVECGEKAQYEDALENFLAKNWPHKNETLRILRD
jgi:hypothetical protein